MACSSCAAPAMRAVRACPAAVPACPAPGPPTNRRKPRAGHVLGQARRAQPLHRGGGAGLRHVRLPRTERGSGFQIRPWLPCLSPSTSALGLRLVSVAKASHKCVETPVRKAASAGRPILPTVLALRRASTAGRAAAGDRTGTGARGGAFLHFGNGSVRARRQRIRCGEELPQKSDLSSMIVVAFLYKSRSREQNACSCVRGTGCAVVNR